MKVINGFFKWLTLLVFSISAGLLAIIFLAQNPALDIFWLRIIILAAIAFIGSLVSRILYHRLPGFLLFLIAFITQILALLIIDHFYEIEYRLSFIAIEFTPIDFSNLVFPIKVTLPKLTVSEYWSDAAQGIILLIISLPTLFFLRRRKKTAKIQKASSSSAPSAAKPKFSLRQKIDPVLVNLNPANWQFPKDIQNKTKQLFNKGKQAVKSKPVAVSPAISKNTSSSKQKSTTTIKRPRKKTASTKVSVPRKRKSAAMNDVKLTSDEEHVCPYCLEKVDKHDPMDVVICPECGTWHHQDCWDLTGSCGVAHRNEL